MNDYILEIVIPTYNRFNRLEKILAMFDKCQSDMIGLTVVDNFSPDSDYTNLKTNPRVRFFTNESNVGAQKNQLISLSYCDRSKYVLMLLDRDQYNFDYLSDLAVTLEEIKMDLGYIDQKKQQDNSPEIIVLDANQIKEQITFIHHPTGYIFKQELLKSFFEKNSLIEVSDLMLPLDFISYWGVSNGFSNFYIIGMTLWTEAEKTFLSSTKSGYFENSPNLIPYTDHNLLAKDFMYRLKSSLGEYLANNLIELYFFNNLLFLCSVERLRIQRIDSYLINRYYNESVTPIKFDFPKAIKTLFNVYIKQRKTFMKHKFFLSFLIFLYNLLNLVLLPFFSLPHNPLSLIRIIKRKLSRNSWEIC